MGMLSLMLVVLVLVQVAQFTPLPAPAKNTPENRKNFTPSVPKVHLCDGKLFRFIT